jgi:FAD/FMN-containing dehydrogenase
MKQPQKARIAEFKARFRGDALLPGDPSYDEVRQIWNAMIDRRPAQIARCASPDAVIQAVNFARKHNMLVSIRGGGHNISGNAVCDDGLMIALSLMKRVRVAPKARRAIIEPGCLLADLDSAAPAHGLATPLGINSTTGVAGLTLGGGFDTEA